MGSKIDSVVSWCCVCTLLVLLGIAESGELLRESVCGSDFLSLDCSFKKSVIVLHRAYVTSNLAEGNITSCASKNHDRNNHIESSELETEDCFDDIRININKKCSGVKRCNYNYQNQIGRLCDGKTSIVVVHYACERESALHRYCNIRLKQKEGYIASPGYPMYYPKLEHECRWNLDAADGHIIVLRPLHFHLRPPTITHFDEEYPIRTGLHPDVIKCDVDFVRIEEGRSRRIDLCGETVQNLEPIQLEASKGVSVTFSSTEFFPGSGFLMYFKVKGCATLTPPEDVRFVSRNGSDALYRCRDDHLVFNDTLENLRLLRCISQHRWNDTLYMPCIEPEEVIRFAATHKSENHSKQEMENMTNDQAPGPPVPQKRTSYLEDMVVPSILMALLIIGNLVIILIIFVIRRRHEAKRGEVSSSVGVSATAVAASLAEIEDADDLADNPDDDEGAALPVGDPLRDIPVRLTTAV